jgi:hypothetical protein
MKTMKKKLTKAKNGKVIKSAAVDPEGNTVKTKTNTRTGATKVVVKYDDPKSSGARREVFKTPGLTRAQRKANEMYAKNPKAAKEDDFKPFTAGMKKGGIKKSKMMVGGTKPKAMYGASMKPEMMKKGGIKKK